LCQFLVDGFEVLARSRFLAGVTSGNWRGSGMGNGDGGQPDNRLASAGLIPATKPLGLGAHQSV